MSSHAHAHTHLHVLAQVRGLVERIEEPMGKLRSTLRLMLDSEEAKEVTKSCASLQVPPTLPARDAA